MDTSIEDRKKELAFNLELDVKVKEHQVKLDGEFIEDVLIRVSKGGGDRVFIISKLPKNLLYMVEKHMMPVGDAQYLKPSGEVWSKTLPGIEHAKEDNSFIFFEHNRESKEKLDAIDRYIQSNWPNNKPLPKREYYAMQPGVNSSPAKPRSMILRVDLPTSPPEESSDSSALGQPSLISKEMLAEIKKQAVEEVKAEIRKEKSAQLVKAREAKAKKKAKE